MGVLTPLLDAFKEYVKDKRYAYIAAPLCTLLSVYGAAAVAAYEFVRSEYEYKTSVGLFLHSYVFLQITIAFAAAAAVTVIALVRRPDGRRRPLHSRVYDYLQKRRRMLLWKGSAIFVVAAAALLLVRHLSPHRVSTIRIVFLNNPSPQFDKGALAYLVYEINRMQRDWYFEVAFDEFNPNSLTSAEEKQFGGPDQKLALVERLSNGKPAIGITTCTLGQAGFLQHAGRYAVISTADWQPFKPPSTYDYLCYCLISESIRIHLEESGALPTGKSYVPARTAKGSLLEFSPTRAAMKPAVLSGHLTDEQEALLFNLFGAEYTKTCGDLLRLDWLHGDRVSGHLRMFGVADVPPPPPAATRPAAAGP